MTASEPGVIERMLVYMSDRCNGAATHDRVGFNKLDTDFGHKLADIVRSGKSLSFNQRAAGYKMLTKYAAQLRGGGFDIAAVPAPEPGSQGIPAKVEGICFVCGQRWEIGALIKFDGRKRRHHADCEPNDQTQEQRQNAIAKQERRTDAPEPTIVAHADHLASIRAEQPLQAATERSEQDYAISPKPIIADPYPMLRSQGRTPTAEDALELAKQYGPGQKYPAPGSFTGRTGMSVRTLLGKSGPIAQRLPGYEERAEQIDCAEAIEQAINAKRHIVVEAGTGVGKSYMYLAASFNSGKKALVSTADKSLQGQLWNKDTPFWQSLFPEFHAAILKGRQNYLCIRDHVKLQNEVDQNLFGIESEGWSDPASVPAYEALEQWAKDTQDGDVESVQGLTPELRERVTTNSDGCAGKRCKFYRDCWVEQAKQRAKRADVVIVNHSLLMRDRRIQMQSSGTARLLPKADVIVIDEAHHLEDQATDAFADELTEYGWRSLERRLSDLSWGKLGLSDEQAERAEQFHILAEGCGATALEAFRFIEGQFSDSKDTEGRTVGHIKLGGFPEYADPIWAAFKALYEKMMDGTPAWLSTEDAEDELWQKLSESIANYGGKLAGALKAPEQADGFVRYAELSRYKKAVVNVKPIEVADLLRQALFDPPIAESESSADDVESDWEEDEPRTVERATVVCTSATIAVGNGMAAWRARVGLDDADELIVGSPFDYPHNAVLYIPDPKRGFVPQYNGEAAEQYKRQIASEMLALCEASGGGAFLLFTSIRMMEYVYSDISYELQEIGLTPMKQYTGGETRAALIERFKATEGAVLFGVASFWEGVDVQGDALRLVVIDKMPFPQPNDPIWAERERAIKERGGQPFTELSVPFATIKIKQGFGRLIRTKTDRGAVAILDSRLRVKPYGRTVIDSLPKARRSEKFENIAALYRDNGC